jgi:hypothetical protein
MLEQATSTCAHHWILGAPRKETTQGSCKLCGETRDFTDALKAPAARRTTAAKSS